MVNGMRMRRFSGISLEPSNLPESAATPTRRVHAVLGGPANGRLTATNGEVGDSDGRSVSISLGVGKEVGVTKLLICLPDIQEDKKRQNISIYLA